MIFTTTLVEPLLAAMSATCHAHSVVYLCFQERCADAHRLFMELAPSYFDVTDETSLMHDTDGCSYARDLDCWLLKLSNVKRKKDKKKKSKKNKKKTKEAKNDADRTAGPRKRKRGDTVPSEHANHEKKLGKKGGSRAGKPT